MYLAAGVPAVEAAPCRHRSGQLLVFNPEMLHATQVNISNDTRIALTDDDAFLVVKGDGAELMLLDPSIHHTTVRPQKLLKNDGTIVRQVVESVRRPNPGLAQQNASFGEGTMFLTLRSFLSANAIRARHSMDDIDHCSSNNSVPCAIQAISAPILITAMGANNYIRFNETHFELARSRDKDFVVVEGANHGQTPCVPCETVPGQYSNTVKNFYDYVRRWVAERY